MNKSWTVGTATNGLLNREVLINWQPRLYITIESQVSHAVNLEVNYACWAPIKDGCRYSEICHELAMH